MECPSTRSTSTRVWQLISLTSLALAFSILAGLGLHQDPRAAKAMHTHGSLVAVTRGSEPLVVGAVWQTLLGDALPSLREEIGAIRIDPSTLDPQAIVAWQYVQTQSLARHSEAHISEFELIGDHGESFRATSASRTAHRIGDDVLLEHRFQQFPRRGKSIKIRGIIDNRLPLDAQELSVVNPAPGHYPVWSPNPRPLVSRKGDLEVSLDHFETGPLPGQFSPSWTSTQVSLKEKGRLVGSSWKVDRIVISDPTGNSWPLRSVQLAGREEEFVELIGLPPEPAFQLKIDVSRAARFPPNEVCRFAGLPCPTQSEVINLRRMAKVQRCKIELIQLLGNDAGVVRGWKGPGAVAVIRVTGSSEHHCLRSRNVTNGHEDQHPTRAADGKTYYVSVGTWNPGASATLDLAITPRVTVTFLAPASRRTPHPWPKPTVLRRNSRRLSP